jgi:hypothetical protein
MWCLSGPLLSVNIILAALNLRRKASRPRCQPASVICPEFWHDSTGAKLRICREIDWTPAASLGRPAAARGLIESPPACRSARSVLQIGIRRHGLIIAPQYDPKRL